MMAVSADSAAWLKSPGRQVVWPLATALSTRRVALNCCLDQSADALAVAARVAAFFEQPLVEELVEITGKRADLFGKCITLTGLPGVAGGKNAFVRQAEEFGSITRLTILRRL